MKTTCHWKEKMTFTAKADEHEVLMDAKSPIGSDRGASPKQLVLMAICGCTAMDVVGLLKKYKQDLRGLDLEAEAEQTQGYPRVFAWVKLKYNFSGQMDAEKVKESVVLSQTKFCGVSAMIAKGCPITYTIELNGELIGEGASAFPT